MTAAGAAYAYRTPGVYFEWLDPGQAGVLPVRTDVAGFVGIAERGPLHRPVRVESWIQFTSVFGGHVPQGFLAWALGGFFKNGGRTCWVVRVADPIRAQPGRLRLLDEHGRPTLRLLASSPGSWSDRLGVTVARTSRDRFALTLRLPGGQQEGWRDLTMFPGDPRYVERVLNDPLTGSRLVLAEDLRATFPDPGPPPVRPAGVPDGGTGWLARGRDGLASLIPAHLTGDGAPVGTSWGLATLEAVEEIAIVAMPDAMPKPPEQIPESRRPELPCEVLDADPEPRPPVREGQLEWPPEMNPVPLQQALIDHCERLRYRVAVLDVRDRLDRVDQALRWREQELESRSAFAALYHPWVRVADPDSGPGALRDVPPSGHVAGVYARGDLLVGVHRPPANEVVEAAVAVTVALDDGQHAELNSAGVNVLRAYPGRGLRIGGARTLSPDPLWRYVNVRRLLCMIEASIERQTQWIVFEPSNPELWRDLDRVIRGFLDRLWRLGMLDGATAAEAYSVQCDEVTNPPENTEAGQLTTLVGVLPPWPAEFVVVRIGRTRSETELLEQGRADDG
jgi:uncharacterized protein